MKAIVCNDYRSFDVYRDKKKAELNKKSILISLTFALTLIFVTTGWGTTPPASLQRAIDAILN